MRVVARLPGPADDPVPVGPVVQDLRGELGPIVHADPSRELSGGLDPAPRPFSRIGRHLLDLGIRMFLATLGYRGALVEVRAKVRIRLPDFRLLREKPETRGSSRSSTCRLYHQLGGCRGSRASQSIGCNRPRPPPNWDTADELPRPYGRSVRVSRPVFEAASPTHRESSSDLTGATTYRGRWAVPLHG